MKSGDQASGLLAQRLFSLKEKVPLLYSSMFMPGPAQCVQAARQRGAVCRALFQFCRCFVHGMRPSTILMPATQFSKCLCCSGSHVWSHRLSRFWPPFLLMSRGESGNTCVPAAARHLYPRTNRDRLRVASHTRTTAWRLCLHFWKSGFPSKKVCAEEAWLTRRRQGRPCRR